MNENAVSDVETNVETWLPGWDGALYAANTTHHRAADAWFLETFPVRDGDRLLDIGCGSGDFTAIVAALVPSGHVVGLDAQPTMVEEAERRAGPNQSFVLGKAQDLEGLFPVDASFDLVYSRATLHWVPRPDHAVIYAQVHRLLRPHGWWRLEMGGAGNVPAVVALLNDVADRHGGPHAPWNFLDAGSAFDLLETAGFAMNTGYVRTVPQRRAFTREEMLGWFASQALRAWEPSMAADSYQAFCEEAISRIDEVRRPDGTYDQTYVRLDALVQRP